MCNREAAQPDARPLKRMMRMDKENSMQVPGYRKTFAMDQGAILSNDQNFHALYHAPPTDPKRQGICTGLSIVWVARRIMFHKEEAAERRSGLVSMGGFRFGGRVQDIHMRSAGGSGSAEDQYRAMYDQALEPFALRIVPGSAVDNPTPIRIGRLVDAVQSARSYCLFSIGLRTPSGSAGHMCASYTSRGTFGQSNFYFFDPNMGEFKLYDMNDVHDFLTAVANVYLDTFSGLNYFDVFEVERG